MGHISHCSLGMERRNLIDRSRVEYRLRPNFRLSGTTNGMKTGTRKRKKNRGNVVCMSFLLFSSLSLFFSRRLCLRDKSKTIREACSILCILGLRRVTNQLSVLGSSSRHVACFSRISLCSLMACERGLQVAGAKGLPAHILLGTI